MKTKIKKITLSHSDKLITGQIFSTTKNGKKHKAILITDLKKTQIPQFSNYQLKPENCYHQLLVRCENCETFIFSYFINASTLYFHE